MAYVPPALRRRQEAAARSAETIDHELKQPKPAGIGSEKVLLPSVSDIQKHFWPNSTATLDCSVAEEVDEHYPIQHHSTLNGTADFPNVLKYILLFKDANPRWDPDGVIFVKTNLNLLSHDKINGTKTSNIEADDETRQQDPALTNHQLQKEIVTDDLTPSVHNIDPVMVFHQGGDAYPRFVFLGYYRISRLEILEPGSEDLVRMLEQKFTLTSKRGKSRNCQRDRDAWKRSLSHRWAVLKMEKDIEANKELQPPAIQASKKRKAAVKQDTPKKSVNEMLQEMRLGLQ